MANLKSSWQYKMLMKMQRNSFIPTRKCKMAPSPWKQCQFLKKYSISMQLPNDAEIVFLGIYSREMKICVHTKICTTYNCPKQERFHMSFNDWMVKETVVHPYHGIFSAIRINQLLVHGATWIYFQELMLSEKSQSQRFTYSIILLIL